MTQLTFLTSDQASTDHDTDGCQDADEDTDDDNDGTLLTLAMIVQLT